MNMFGVDIEAQALAQGLPLPMLVDSGLRYLENRLSPTLVDYWIMASPTNKMQGLCDAVNARPGSLEELFESWSSEAAVAALIKAYLHELPSK